MKKLVRLGALTLVTCASFLFSAGAQAAIVVSSYDITNARPSGDGGWAHTYNGSITANGSGRYNYAGGSGTLNDGVIGSTESANELFHISDNSVITLHLDGVSTLSKIDIFGGANTYNSIPGTLTGARITIGGVSIDLSSTEFGASCQSGLCNDAFDLSGTTLAALATDTVTLSNFTGGWNDYFSITEINVDGAAAAVPEPASLGLLGLGLFGFVAARRRKQ